MSSPSPRAGRTTLLLTLPLALAALTGCDAGLHFDGPAQTVTVTAPGRVTVKGKTLTLSSVRSGAAALAVDGAGRVLRTGDSFWADDVHFTVDAVDDSRHTATLTGKVEKTFP